MKEPIQKPINIPGRRKVLTKNRILESQKHTKSNMEAARWLEVNYNTYKKWAKYYGNEVNMATDTCCLAVDFIDGDVDNWLLENIRLLCANCYLSFNGWFYSSKRFCK